ncbi:hypothetical protein KUF54_06100 [Comamonas sp. Y33R10-2]|uniref:hypothetical protein n=1 Tax=Comamonas sp. Y33R10-2 TaxID=2853257 RepID=UPI001C5C843C|nr:hypothetical protein [Comamonas sp. Y33R10-2]QXZ10775.1 hypothetical protein KUF54_06100 [Comamonas sp. Y33R10-2]
MSCEEWGFNPTAVGAIATAAATCVALFVVIKDARSRLAVRRQALRVAIALLDDELTTLTSYGEGWQIASLLVIEQTTKAGVRETAESDLLASNLRAYIDNQTHLSEQTMLAAIRVLNITSTYRKAFSEKSCAPLNKKKGSYETHYAALTAEVQELRRLMNLESQSCW